MLLSFVNQALDLTFYHLMYFKQKYWGVCDENDVNLPKIKQILSDHGYGVNIKEKLLPYSSSEDLDGYGLEITW